MQFNVVKGKNKGKIQLFGLSTCIWCKKTKELLDKIGCQYEYIFIDLLNEKNRQHALKEVKKWNPRSSFPTVVINNKKCIIGFKEDELKEALNL
jgi:glutaredoxin